MSLREELARRLYKATYPELEPHNASDLWLLIADECIRQMEWARETVPMTKTLAATFRDLVPLTLAPEDWKP